MPFYDYICSDCAHEFDTLQKMSDEPLKDCPQCQQPTLSKKVVAPVFRLKGGGWYETDFKTGDKKNVVHSDKPATSADSNTADKKTDKPAESKTKTSAEKPTKTNSAV